MTKLSSRKWVFIGGGVVIFLAFLVWLFMISTKPLPGIEALQNSRNHIPEGSKTDFKFNPPTSGDHYPSWISKGFYDEPRHDGNLVHSMEHGYIIIWYDCEKKSMGYGVGSIVGTAFAQSVPMTGGSEGTPSAKLSDMPKQFSDGSCDTTKNQIKTILNKFGMHKLIAMPRAGMDYPIILTAWGREEKLNLLDEGKIKEFIGAFRDNGPEKTNEP